MGSEMPFAEIVRINSNQKRLLLLSILVFVAMC